MKAFNLFDGELDKRRDQAGFSWTAAALGPVIGGREIGASLYELEPGDTVLSTKGPFPTVAVYPDSDKLGVWLADGYSGLFRRGDTVDYWEGEGLTP